MYRLLYFIPSWLAFELINIPATIAGLFVVPFMYRYRFVLYDDLPWWFRPWANPEDHYGGFQGTPVSLPQWWVDREGDGFKAWWWYHAIRNSANGLRSIEFLDLDIDPARVRFITPTLYRHYSPPYMRKQFPAVKTYWYLAWQGYQGGFDFTHHWPDTPDNWFTRLLRIRPGPRYFDFKIGWRVQPSDQTVVINPVDPRARDAGFSNKLLVYRRG